MAVIFTQAETDGQRVSFDGVESAIRSLDDSKDKPFGEPIDVIGVDSGAPLSKVVLCDPSAGALVLSIQPLSTMDIGKIIVVKNNSASTNTITIQCMGATIDGAASGAITTARGVLRLYVISAVAMVVI